MLSYIDNVKAILECNFAGFKEEIIDNACKRIGELSQGQRHGNWIVYKDREGKTRRCKCDRCGYETGSYTWTNPNFCAECGAKMESVVQKMESEDKE